MMFACSPKTQGVTALVFLAVCSLTHAVPGPDRSGEDPLGGTGQWRVGPPSDPDCHFSDIQDAIDATVSNDGGFATINVLVGGSASVHRGNTYTLDLEQFDNVTTFRVIGGHDGCQGGPVNNEETVLDADNNGRLFDLVYEVGPGASPRSVHLSNLRLTGGNAPGAGGGLRIRGHSERLFVALNDVTITGNQTQGQGSGGGVSIEATTGSDSPTNWFVASNVRISDNQARGVGGGFACFNVTGEVNPPMILSGVTVLSNSADAHGGGVALTGCRNVRITNSSGVLFSNAIALNSAGAGSSQGHGGGVWVTQGGELRHVASGAADAGAAVIANNTADHGGGVFVDDVGSRVDLSLTQVSDNFARGEGGGIYVGQGARVLMDRRAPLDTVTLGDCQSPALFPLCSRIENNHADGHGGALRLVGGTIVTDRALVEINQTFINDNSAGGDGSAANLSGRSTLLMEGVAVHGNSGAVSLFRVHERGLVSLDWSTVVANETDGNLIRVFRLDGTNDVGVLPATMRARGSIIWQPGSSIVVASDQTLATADCVIGHLLLPNNVFDEHSFYSRIDPSLVDPENGDVRLARNSPAIDYCSTTEAGHAPQRNDIFNNPRGIGFNAPTIDPPNGGNGAFDLGSHERQPLLDEIFQDRFAD